MIGSTIPFIVLGLPLLLWPGPTIALYAGLALFAAGGVGTKLVVGTTAAAWLFSSASPAVIILGAGTIFMLLVLLRGAAGTAKLAGKAAGAAVQAIGEVPVQGHWRGVTYVRSHTRSYPSRW